MPAAAAAAAAAAEEEEEETEEDEAEAALLPDSRSLFSRTLEPPSSPESRLLKFHTMSVCTSSTVSAAIRAERERRASLRAHQPPTIVSHRGKSGACTG